MAGLDPTGAGMETIQINDTVAIPASELDFSYARSSGPGGQNVNKVETKVVLRFDLARTESLHPLARARALRKLHTRVTKAGQLVLHCDQYRDRERNRAEAVERFRQMLGEAIARPRRRVATRPSRAQRERRISDKKQRSKRKRQRSRPNEE